MATLETLILRAKAFNGRSEWCEAAAAIGGAVASLGSRESGLRAAYQGMLAAHGLSCSMSRQGDCWGNTVVESFFATLEHEL
jgi:transposase InsO family protein